MPEVFSYRGWIPVLSGYISFRNACGQLIPARCGIPSVRGDLADKDGLFVIQERELKDETVPSISWTHLRNKLPASTGMFTFSMQSTWTDADQTAIKGRVYARPTKANSSIGDVAPDHSLLPVIVNETNGWVVDFTLARCGTIDLTWGEIEPASVLEIIDTEFSETSAEDAINRLTFQTYLFLKDFVHSHKFHNGDDDSILVPYRVTSSEDSSWFERTARNLHASIITSMRGGRFDTLNATGQTAYLRTFLRLAEKDNSLQCGLAVPSLDVLLEGCRAKLERERLVESEKTSLGAILLTLLFSFVAVLVAMLQLLQIPCISAFANTSSCSHKFQVNPFAVDVAEFALGHWAWSVAAVYLLVCIILYVFFRRAMHDIVSQRIGHRRLDWVLLRPVFGSLLGDHGRVLATIWLVLLVAFVLGLVWLAMLGLISSVR
jgi:hypothetical protein